MGSLSCAFLDRWINDELCFNSVEVTAYEIEKNFLDHLTNHLKKYSNAKYNILLEDYIKSSTYKGLQEKNTHMRFLIHPIKRLIAILYIGRFSVVSV